MRHARTIMIDMSDLWARRRPVSGLALLLCALVVLLLAACAGDVIVTGKHAEPDPDSGAVTYTIVGGHVQSPARVGRARA